MVECKTVIPDALGNYWDDPAYRPIVDPSLMLWLTSDFGNSDTWTDLSGKDNHGTILEATRTPLHPLGIFGSALEFNGHSSLVDCGDNASLFSDAFTVCAWVKAADSTRSPILNFGHIRPNLSITWDTDKAIIYLGASNYRYFNHDPVDLDNGDWHYVVFVVTGNGQNDIDNSKMYADGQELTVFKTFKTGLPESKTHTYIGKYGAGEWTHWLHGIIGELVVYNRVLSLPETIHNYTHSSVYHIQKIK